MSNIVKNAPAGATHYSATSGKYYRYFGQSIMEYIDVHDAAVDGCMPTWIMTVGKPADLQEL